LNATPNPKTPNPKPQTTGSLLLKTGAVQDKKGPVQEAPLDGFWGEVFGGRAPLGADPEGLAALVGEAEVCAPDSV